MSRRKKVVPPLTLPTAPKRNTEFMVTCRCGDYIMFEGQSLNPEGVHVNWFHEHAPATLAQFTQLHGGH